MVEAKAPTVEFWDRFAADCKRVPSTSFDVLNCNFVLCKPSYLYRVVEVIGVTLAKPAKVSFSAGVHATPSI